MKSNVRTWITAAALLFGTQVLAQDGSIRTIFKNKPFSSGGYGAVTNTFTRIRGDFANLSGIYGGWFINHRLMLGISGSAVTNNIRVPLQYSTDPQQQRSYEYGQFGLMAEYVIGSSKPIHLVLQGMGGAGFTLQYLRYGSHGNGNGTSDENWFIVAEPGVQVEFNLFKWMRFSPGVSYRQTFGSDGRGMEDKDLSGVSFNATLKFGKF